ncbi:CBS domain-containing protein [Deinococcus detaillensis]|uniref:CBS domain-containing protein n=1 Tax=Deinococcus detaillensis TaxID=2592048 RepID=A0A553UNJ4_9DEIO|nr:CBS domain-containing protein [Deinococcus detaillensis]TSA81777.1 CBS domain-containing protein [Deinococcus detaillensis]
MNTSRPVSEVMTPRPLTLSPSANLAKAAMTMQTMRVERLPVVHQGQLVGILTDGEVRRALPAIHEGLTPWEFAVRAGSLLVRQAMRSPVLTVEEHSRLGAALEMMVERRIGGVPVVNEDGGLVGILTLTDVLKAAAQAAPLTWGRVGNHMTSSTVSVDAGALASEGAARLKISQLRVLPVLEGGRLVGVLHEKDVFAAVERASSAHGDTVLSDQFMLGQLKVTDLMKPSGAQVRSSAPMEEAMKAMLSADVHGLPVMGEGGHLLGVITISDMLKAILDQSAQEQPELVQRQS